MLSKAKAHAAIAVTDMNRAKSFYRDKLKLRIVSEADGGIMFSAGEGSEFFVFVSPSAGTAKNSVMGFTTDDIKREVAELKAVGVVFEEYDYPMLKTVGGVAETADESLSAWFKDDDGNTLGLVQFKK